MSRPRRGPLVSIDEFCALMDINPRKFWQAVAEGILPVPQLIPPTYARLGLRTYDETDRWGEP